MQLKRIISGGQTGVDRGALDAAIHSGLPHGGWCPAGQKAEDGEIPDNYMLSETKTNKYQERTQCNVKDSDASLICLGKNAPGEGANLTIKWCNKLRKPCLKVNIFDENAVDKAFRWMLLNNVVVLNVAGNRESGEMGVQKQTCLFIFDLLLKFRQ